MLPDGGRPRPSRHSVVACMPSELGGEPEHHLLRSLDRPEGRYLLSLLAEGVRTTPTSSSSVCRGAGVQADAGTRIESILGLQRADSATPQAHLRRILGLAIGKRGCSGPSAFAGSPEMQALSAIRRRDTKARLPACIDRSGDKGAVALRRDERRTRAIAVI